MERSKYNKGKKKKNASAGSATHGHCWHQYQVASWFESERWFDLGWRRGYAVPGGSARLLRIWFRWRERNGKAAWLSQGKTVASEGASRKHSSSTVYLLQLPSCPHNQAETKHFILSTPNVLEFIITSHSVTLSKSIALCLGLLIWGMGIIKVSTT